MAAFHFTSAAPNIKTRTTHLLLLLTDYIAHSVAIQKRGKT